jgi:polysaccharide biosynthesis protein PslH
MNILFICHRIPYPPNKGEKIRSYNILKYISSRHDVHLAFLVDDEQDLVHVETLRPMVKSLHYDVINPKLKKLISSIALLGSKPISVPYFYSKSLQKDIDSLLDSQDIDCILCYSSPTAEYIFRSNILKDGREKTAGSLSQTSDLRPQTSGHRPSLLMDFIDLDSYKWAQYAERSKFPMKWVYRHEAKYLRRYESRITAEFNHSLITSEDEKRLFLENTPGADISSMGNGVDTVFFNPEYRSRIQKKGKHIVFTGMMDYLPNIEGIIWFSEKIFPSIQGKHSDTTLYIVGNRPSSEIKALANRPSIVVTGFVEDVRDYLSIADICIAPLRIARGVQNKVLEAMAMGKSTVCTLEALNGIHATPGEEVAVASNEKTFSEQIINLLSAPGRSQKLGRNARAFVEKNASWEAQLAVLDKVLKTKD